MPISQIILARGGSGGGSPSINFYGYSNPMNEGAGNNVYINYSNYPATWIYWRIVNDTTSNEDWEEGFEPSGSLYLEGTGNVNFSWNTAADYTPDGTETYYVQVSATPGGSDLLNAQLTISDTSTQPPFTYDDFTIEWWQKVESSNNNPRPWAFGSYPTQRIAISYESNAADYYWINNNAIGSVTRNHVNQGWQHMAMVRRNGVVKGYENGVEYFSDPDGNSAILDTTAPLYVGTGETNGAGNFRGYIKDLHIVKGYAKYTSNFTPLTVPVQPRLGTIFLMPTTDSGTVFNDTVGSFTATVTGTPTWSSDTPFTTATPYTMTGAAQAYNPGLSTLYILKTTDPGITTVRAGWTVSSANYSGTVTSTTDTTDYYNIIIAVSSGTLDSGIATFTQPALGGSVYFNGSSFLNYGGSAQWAMDFDNLVYSGITLNIDANNTTSYPGAGATTWTDLSGTGNITLYGSPSYTTGPPSSINFSGTGQYGVGVTNGVIPTTGYTKSVWFKVNNTTSDNNLVSSDNGGHYVFMNATNRIYCGHGNWGATNINPSVATITAGTWYMVTVTFDPAVGMNLYINGQLDHLYDANLDTFTGNGSTNIACYAPGGNLLNGSIGRVLCYNRALSAPEVLFNFNATRNRYGV